VRNAGAGSEARLGQAKQRLMLVLIPVALILASCAAGPNAQQGRPDASGDVAGFWLGLWHGIIAPFTFVISLFADSVNLYEVHNNGNWYNFGFALGAGILLGGGGLVGRKKRKS
jgi:LPXTG-motif cell wall-anchored protein